jgi:hypothetical protein
MSCCTHCGKTTAATGGEKPKSCGKCRDVTYCDVECQKADWDTHKTSCEPCAQYVSDKVMALHASKQWRKLIKWHPYIEEHIFTVARLRDNTQLNAQVFTLHSVLALAYKLGIIATSDPGNVYAKAAVPVLEEMVELERKANHFAGQGAALCDLAEMTCYVLGKCNKISVKYYQQASVIALQHGTSRVQAAACHGLGMAASGEDRQFEAATLFRTAVAEAAKDDDSELEVCYSLQLFDQLLKLNSIDEAETLIQRLPRLIQRVTGPNFKGLTHMQLHYHLQSARVHEARGNPSEAEREVRKLIALVHENKSTIHDWRPTLLNILKVTNKKLKVLHPETGNKSLVKSMADLAYRQRMPHNYTCDGVEWREVLIER